MEHLLRTVRDLCHFCVNLSLKHTIKTKIKLSIIIYLSLVLDDLRGMKGYCHLQEEALDRTVWRAGFGRSFGPVVRQTAK